MSRARGHEVTETKGILLRLRVFIIHCLLPHHAHMCVYRNRSQVCVQDERSIISLIANVKRSSDVMASVFEILSKEKIQVEMLSQGASKVRTLLWSFCYSHYSTTSPTSLSCLFSAFLPRYVFYQGKCALSLIVGIFLIDFGSHFTYLSSLIV